MHTATRYTIPGFEDSEFFREAKHRRDRVLAHGPIGPADVDPNYESPNLDRTTHCFELRDGQGNGYAMRYDYWRSLTVEIFEHGEQVFCETFHPTDAVGGVPNYERFKDIEYMVLTARSVGDAILQDEFDGCLQGSFLNGYATLADRLDMFFELADPTSNQNVRCTLNAVAPDLKHYDTMLTFTVPSMDLWAATNHLTTLCG